ncbi:AAA-like domain-containing protein [Vibrio harveyi]|uniref:AAA-like domain-containing protein n=1 Tax=Vibrio harveyi TaxID=669 RepID=UPI0031B9E7C0
MNNKVLKNYTTIPPHLYVERSADKQLKYIIEDMQRPGYVLVARQMGKTNLLFNARRNLESDSRKFVYIDLSNNFATERECYNFIVESILDVLDDELWEIRSEIEKISERTITDHVFYTKSLLKILRHLNKDLVIILDEIDALRTSEYSDSIFAVIRSNYFTRTNFPEFERLTYILSGVIEPKDLIKDRNKSPFNIGEKIYLDDFSFDEFCDFIDKSKLNIENELKNHIFSWTKGNPRLTFDICSDIESVLTENNFIDCKSIDELIKEKYLISFDIAPIDHIRELVSDDKDIQDAIIKLQSNEEKLDITDKVKSKLYLYGIISSGDKYGSFHIKNKIIKKSLSLSWIKSLSDNTDSIVRKAIQLIEKSLDYHQGIELISSIIDQIEQDDSTGLSLALYYLGYAEHRVGEYERSNIHLLEKPFSKNASPVMHYRARLFAGINFLMQDNKDAGNEHLQYVVDNYENTVTWSNAALILANNNLGKEGSINLLKRIVDTTEKTQPEVESETETSNNLRIIKSYAFFSLSSQYENSFDKIKYLEDAIEIGVLEHIPYLILVRNEAKGVDSDETITNVTDFILKNHVRFGSSNLGFSTIDYSYEFHLSVVAANFINNSSEFKKLVEYSVNELNIHEDELFFDMARIIDVASERARALEFYFKKASETPDIKLYRLYIASHLDSDDSEVTCYCLDYIKEVIKSKHIVRSDIAPISMIIRASIEHQNPEDFENSLIMLEPILFGSSEVNHYDSSVLFYWMFEYYNFLKSKEKSNKYAVEALERLTAPKEDKTVIDEEGEKIIKTRMIKVLHRRNALPTAVPVRKRLSYGRNDKVTVVYKTGDKKTDKFKKLENDIKMGMCEIIN